MFRTTQKIMKRIGDESWIHAHDPQTIDQSNQHRAKDDPRRKKPRESLSKVKVMLTVLFDCHNVVHYKLLPPEQEILYEFDNCFEGNEIDLK